MATPRRRCLEILKNELNRQTEENRQKDILIQRLQEEKSQLSESHQERLVYSDYKLQTGSTKEV